VGEEVIWLRGKAGGAWEMVLGGGRGDLDQGERRWALGKGFGGVRTEEVIWFKLGLGKRFWVGEEVI
jgi:hypothetical protein